MEAKMQKFVFWTGVYNAIAGFTFLFPGFATRLGVTLPASNVWVWTVAVAIIYLGVALILCSRDLKNRATFVYWEGLLRLVAFFLFAGFGFFGDLGTIMGILGIGDLVIGLVYLIGLPKALQASPAELLFDRVIDPSVRVGDFGTRRA